MISTQPTPDCFCSAMHTSLECPTHGEMFKRSLQHDAIWRIIVETDAEYERGEALTSLD